MHANRKVLKAERDLRALSRREAALRRRAASARLLSDQLALDQRAVQLGVRVSDARARVSSLQAVLSQARQDLAQARDRSLSASFAPAAGSLMAAPAYDGQYVFPVGGGPSLVSVSHHHHDYPAADIAAPEGSPVYALADATVVRSYDTPDGRCGIGLTIDTADGQEWTYCHLSFLDPTVTDRRPARRRHRGRPRRDDRPRHGPAPASPARPDDLVPAAAALVPELRGRRLPLAGRRPDRLDRQRQPRGGCSPSSPPKRRNRMHRSSCSPGRGMTSHLSAAEGKDMAVRLAALLPRAVIVALVWILGTAAFTLAADNTIVGPSTPNPSAGAAAAQTELVVPSVSGQAYVFAKGILEDSGFAWRVVGSVRGYSSNRVITQSPAAGTRVVDTGAPTVIVRLVRGPYDQLGRPVDVSPYRGTAIRLAGLAAVTKPAVTPKPKPAPKPGRSRSPS